MNECILTIITVSKNCLDTIGRTFESVKLIKDSNIEYLVIDGASTDGTLDIIRAHSSLINMYISEPDSGIYNAMNKGVALANGKYVLFINGDDELVSEGFPLVMALLSQGRDEIVCATTLVEGSLSAKEILVAKPWRLPFFNSIPHPSTFVSRKLLLSKPFREDLRIVSDYHFFLSAYLSGKFFNILPVLTARHRRGGASGDTTRSEEELQQVRRELLGWHIHIYNVLAGIYKFFKLLLNV